MSSFQKSTSSPLSVSALTASIRAMVEELFAEVTVVGEISNFVRSKTGHCYFSLKDDGAQIQTVLWRTTAARVKFAMQNGLAVVCRGRVEVYPPQGKYQLIVSEIEPRGIGALELAFRQLHEKLRAAGLFDVAKKKLLPTDPRRIAVVTSPTSAAVRDFLNILRARSKRVDVLIVPVAVQGESASREIAAALALLAKKFSPNASDPRYRLDAVALIRGGGSTEDLWAFNEERTVHAVAASPLPIITGIGHEIDVVLADLAADVRALTPSDAAAKLIPDDAQNLLRVERLAERLFPALTGNLRRWNDRFARVEQAAIFQRPNERLVHGHRAMLEATTGRLVRGGAVAHAKWEKRFVTTAVQLESLSPLAVLSRGYSLTQNGAGRLVRSVAEVNVGETLMTRLAEGILESRVSATHPSEAER